MNYWLLKSEPETFSIDALAKAKNQRAPWDGVRNYQARNILRDQMRVGDFAFFYHSSCKVPGIVGIVKIVKQGYPDPTDELSHSKNPRWYCVDVELVRKLNHLIPLSDLRKNSSLKKMQLLQKGNRLSVMPITKEEWHTILAME